jgi:hypothetical protein
LRRMTITREIKSDIFKQLTVQTASSKILFTICLDFVNISFVDDLNFLFKFRDIYNVKAKLRRDDLNSLTSVQILMRELNRDDDDWIYFFQTDDQSQITHLFFVKRTSQEVLKRNYEVLVMNCIYKINKYKMSLLIICDQTKLHINFYVVFCFMIKKKMSNYRWTLNQLKILYARLKNLNFIIFVIDMKKKLMIARYLIFSNFNHLFFIWHINNNVLINCKKSFVIKENWNEFFQKWKNVIYASTKSKFRKIWNAFSNKYNLSHEDCVKYLIDTYIRNHDRRFVKTYINQDLHFETMMSSRNEIEHVQLKRYLRALTDDLKRWLIALIWC